MVQADLILHCLLNYGIRTNFTRHTSFLSITVHQFSKEIREYERADEHFEDQFPPSKKAQVLREVLEQEYNDKLPANINDMWTRFQTHRDQSVSESSLNSTRLDALSGLLQDPTSHAVNSFIKTKRNDDRQRQRLVEEKSREKEVSEKKC